MSKQLIPTKLYNDVITILFNKGLIPFEQLPLRWTNSKNCYGYLKWANMHGAMIYMGVYLNKSYCPCTVNDVQAPGGLKSFLELLDTICHELAHITYEEHGDSHRKLHLKYQVIVAEELHLNNREDVLNYVSSCKTA